MQKLITPLCTLMLWLGTNAQDSINRQITGLLRDIENLKYRNEVLEKAMDVFTVIIHNNATVAAFKAKFQMSINMNELNGNEKYYDLTDNLPVNTSNPGTIHAGDLVLYGSNTLVLFYKTFSTS